MKRSTFKVSLAALVELEKMAEMLTRFSNNKIANLRLNIFLKLSWPVLVHFKTKFRVISWSYHQATIRNCISYKFIGLSDGDHKWHPVLVTDHGRHYGSEVGWWLCHSSSLSCIAGTEVHSLPWFGTCYSSRGITSVSRYNSLIKRKCSTL